MKSFLFEVWLKKNRSLASGFLCFFDYFYSTTYVVDQLSYCMTSCDLKPVGLSESGREFVPDTWLSPKNQYLTREFYKKAKFSEVWSFPF